MLSQIMNGRKKLHWVPIYFCVSVQSLKSTEMFLKCWLFPIEISEFVTVVLNVNITLFVTTLQLRRS